MTTLDSPLEILPVNSPELLEQCFALRREVFVEEQKVNPADEIDVHEHSSRHFLIRQHEQAVATARWRRTPKGIKLERFAVKKSCRGLGIGRTLLQAVLQDIATSNTEQLPVYLHAQLAATALYYSEGFARIGPQFDECGISHVKMVLQDAPGGNN